VPEIPAPGPELDLGLPPQVLLDLGAKIRAARTAAGMTQEALAEALDRTQTAVSYWEAGKRDPGGMKLVLRPVEPGLHRIVADGQVVGHIYDEWDPQDHWNGRRVAALWAAPGCPDQKVAIVKRLRLRDLRAELNRRLETDGPWWSETEGHQR
jgi:DNA-binding XRE family transcriptional regulator